MYTDILITTLNNIQNLPSKIKLNQGKYGLFNAFKYTEQQKKCCDFKSST